MIVVAAVDGSKHTHAVVDAARRYAGDGAIHLVYVWNGAFVYPYMGAAGVMLDIEAIRRDQLEDVWRTVGDLPKNATATTLEGGPPAEMIVDYARNVDADLVVVGSRGRGALSTLFLGSVSHGIAHTSDTDVLIVK